MDEVLTFQEAKIMQSAAQSSRPFNKPARFFPHVKRPVRQALNAALCFNNLAVMTFLTI